MFTEAKTLHLPFDAVTFHFRLPSILGIRQEQEYIKTKAFKEFGAKVINHIHPLCKQLSYDSDDYWRCVIRSDTLTIYHPTSSCKMGRIGDNTTVVDSQLRQGFLV